jgi:short-subunit dehydrogenase
MNTLNKKVALITGASSGIGAEIARQMARQGASVVLTARRIDRLDDLAKEIETAGGQALALECDVCRDGDVDAAVARALERFGHLDIVVANAGFGIGGTLDRLSLDDFRRQMETNVFGVLRTILASREALIESRGRLALMGSVAGEIPTPSTSPYGMSKAAIRSLAASLHAELKPSGVSVTLLAPGYVDSEIRHLDRQGRHREGAVDPVPRWLRARTPVAARVMVRAIRRRRRFQVITGHGRLIVLAQRVSPGLVSWLFCRMATRRARYYNRQHT